jgi:hypothetical protein
MKPCCRWRRIGIYPRRDRGLRSPSGSPAFCFHGMRSVVARAAKKRAYSGRDLVVQHSVEKTALSWFLNLVARSLQRRFKQALPTRHSQVGR